MPVITDAHNLIHYLILHKEALLLRSNSGEYSVQGTGETPVGVEKQLGVNISGRTCMQQVATNNEGSAAFRLASSNFSSYDPPEYIISHVVQKPIKR